MIIPFIQRLGIVARRKGFSLYRMQKRESREKIFGVSKRATSADGCSPIHVFLISNPCKRRERFGVISYVTRKKRTRGFAFCDLCRYFFVIRFDSLNHRAENGNDIEKRAAFHSFKEQIQSRGEFPECHQNKDGQNIDERANQRDQRENEAGGVGSVCCASSCFEKEEEHEGTNRDIAKIVIRVGIIVDGIDIRGCEENNGKERREERENFFHFFGATGGCVDDEIKRRREKQCKRSQTQETERRCGRLREKLFCVIKRDQTSDGKKDKAEKCAGKNRNLIARSGQVFKTIFADKEIGGRHQQQGKCDHVTERLQRGFGLRSIFIIIGIIISEHQHDTPDGKSDTDDEGRGEVRAHNFFC